MVAISYRFGQTHFLGKTHLLRELRLRIKRIGVIVVAGLLLLIPILPQLALAAGPEILNVVVLDRTSTTATIVWTTNNASDSRVNYGTTTPLSKHKDDSAEVTHHYITLEGLQPGTKYYFAVESDGERSPANPSEYYSFTTLSVTSYSITLDHACGVCGELRLPEKDRSCGEVIGVTVTVAAAGTYYICWDSRTAWDPTKATGAVDTFKATGAGSHSLEFWMPEAKRGPHTVYLVDNTYAEKKNAIFEVGPSVKIDPEDGPVGTEVTVNCYGFDASQKIRLKFDGTEVKQDTTDKDFGSWTVSYTIPDIPAGDYTFDVEVEEGTVGWVCWVSKYFEVTPQITAPDSGTVGHAIEVKGTGFASKEKDIEVTFDGEPVKTNIPLVADENGSWKATIVIPPLQRGTYTIGASGMSTRARDVDGVECIVGAGILVEPGSADVGDMITVAGGGFRPGETGIKVKFGGEVVAPATGSITAGMDGSWETSFDLPASTYGSNTVEASGDITKPAVKTTLKTKARIEEPSPDEGAPGDYISLTGSGFSGGQALTVRIGGVAVTENLQTQPNGNVVITFRVPKGSIEGTGALVVTDEGGATASVDFTVTKKTLSTTPLPISPKGSTLRSGMVTFRWQGVSGDTGYTYTLEINTTADSGNNWSKSGIEGSSYTLTKTETVDEALDKGTYYWRVKIADDYGNESDWSDSSEFRVSPIQTWVWVVVGVVVLVVLMVVAYRETKFKVTE